MPTAPAISQPRDAAGKLLSQYDAEVMANICVRIAEGETLAHICKEKDKPTAWTFRNWVLKDEELRGMYTQARELQAHSLFEEALDEARAIKAAPGSAQQVRAADILITHLRWAAGKLNARDYSERSSVRFVVPIQINTSLDLGGGDVDPDKVYDITAEVIVDPEEAEERQGKATKRRLSERDRQREKERARARSRGKRKGMTG